MRRLKNRTVTCPKCGYQWEPRVDNPKRCPRCGKWLLPKPSDKEIIS